MWGTLQKRVQSMRRSAMKCYVLDMTRLLHTWFHSSCGSLYKVKTGKNSSMHWEGATEAHPYVRVIGN